MKVGTIFGWRLVPRSHYLTHGLVHGRGDDLVHLFVHATDGGYGSYASVCGKVRTTHAPPLPPQSGPASRSCGFCRTVAICGLAEEVRLEGEI